MPAGLFLWKPHRGGKMTEILNRKGVAELFKMPVRTVDYLVQTGQIPLSRLGKRSVRFNKARLAEWFADREGVECRYKTNKDKAA
jgi:excisionase family DNA binding protein